VPDFDTNILLASARLAKLAADPDAVHWARECAWVPGTGHCGNRRCSAECLFRPQRLAEAGRITTLRRSRRPTQQLRAGRRPRPASVLLAVAVFLELALG